jgi:hypothetical protein
VTVPLPHFVYGANGKSYPQVYPQAVEKVIHRGLGEVSFPRPALSAEHQVAQHNVLENDVRGIGVKVVTSDC